MDTYVRLWQYFSSSSPSSSSFTSGLVCTSTVDTAAYSWLYVPPCFRVSLVSARRAPRTDVAWDLWQRKGQLWARNGRVHLAYNYDFHGNCKDHLHAAKLRHGADGFTFPPKEGALRIFFRPKNPTALAGFEVANLGTGGQRANH
jgi:hypothetical protein